MDLIAGMRPGWFFLALGCNFAALVCRAERWRTILSPRGVKPAYYPTFVSVTVGFMSSTILPVRAGDVVRAALMKRRTGIRFSTSIATVLTERVLDLLSILTLLSYFVMVTLYRRDFPPAQMAVVRSVGLVAAAILLLMFSFIIGILFFHPVIRRMHIWLGRWIPLRFREPWMAFFDSFVSSVAIARAPGPVTRILLMTMLIWTLLSAQFYFVALALGHDLPFRSSFFMTGMSILGLMIPTPGGVGGFHKVVQIVLTSFYNFSIDASVALAMVFHIVGTAPVVLAGTLLLIREGLSLKQVTHMGESPEEDTDAGPAVPRPGE